MKISGIVSIYPKYALGVMHGIKRIEWRKKNSFDDLDYFLNRDQDKNLILHITQIMERPLLIIKVSKIEVGDPLCIYNSNLDKAGITVLDLLDYYNKRSLTELLFKANGNKSIMDMKFKENAYALHIKHCYSTTEFISREIINYIKSLDLKLFKGLKSVSKLELELNDDTINTLW